MPAQYACAAVNGAEAAAATVGNARQSKVLLGKLLSMCKCTVAAAIAVARALHYKEK